MATLISTLLQSRRGNSRLEVTPNLPENSELTDTYTIKLWVGEELVYDRVQSMRNWQMRHFYVEQIAHAFCNVDKWIDKSTSLSVTDSETKKQANFNFPDYAELNTEWLRIFLAAWNRPQNKGEIVVANIYLTNIERTAGNRDGGETWGEWQEITSASIFCSLKEAKQFGTNLLSEIEAAEAMRIKLGIPEYDDAKSYQP